MQIITFTHSHSDLIIHDEYTNVDLQAERNNRKNCISIKYLDEDGMDYQLGVLVDDKSELGNQYEQVSGYYCLHIQSGQLCFTANTLNAESKKEEATTKKISLDSQYYLFSMWQHEFSYSDRSDYIESKVSKKAIQFSAFADKFAAVGCLFWFFLATSLFSELGRNYFLPCLAIVLLFQMISSFLTKTTLYKQY